MASSPSCPNRPLEFPESLHLFLPPSSSANVSYFIVKPISYHHASSSSSATSEQTLKRSTVPTTGQATPDTSARQPGHGSWNLSDPPSQLLFSSLSVTPKPAGASAQLVHLQEAPSTRHPQLTLHDLPSPQGQFRGSRVCRQGTRPVLFRAASIFS